MVLYNLFGYSKAIIYRRKIMASVSQSVFPLFGRKSNNSSHTHRHIHTQLKGERVKKEPYHRLYNTVDGITYKYIAGWRAIEIFED